MITFYLTYPEGIPFGIRFTTLLTLYAKVLYKDPDWHFFFEDEEGDIIRCSDKYFKVVEKTLKEYRIEYSWKEWVDDHAIVNEYKKYFTRIFHENAELVMTIYKDALITNKTIDYAVLRDIVDRIVHSLFNKLFMTLIVTYPRYETYNKEVLEPHVLSIVTNNRWFYCGIREQSKRQREYEKELKRIEDNEVK